MADRDVDRILVVAAHPDDADFGCSASMASWNKAGKQVTLLCVTRGEQGALPDADIAAIPQMRENEQRLASAELGVTDVRFLDGHRDGSVVATPELVKQIVRIIREVRPQRVVAQSPERNYDRIFGSHPDHLATGNAAVQACYPACENVWAYPDLLAEGLAEWKVGELWLMAHPAPDFALDVTEHFEAKMAALLQHSSQTGHRDNLDGLLRNWMTMNSERFGLAEGRLSEAYKVVPING
jgi:LmbE family N-acetylglucosaminyl deacetylase